MVWSWIGCALTLPEPIVQRVTPDFAWHGDATDVSVLGRDFVAALRADGGGGAAERLDDWDLSLVRDEVVLPLLDVRRVDDGQIDATVPADWPAGTYDVRVESADGRSSVLADGFVLTETRADHFVLSSDDSFVVGTVLVLQVQLVDRDEHRVFEDLAVDVTVAGVGGAVVEVGGLDDEVGFPEPGHVTGRLGADGEVALFVEAAAPDIIELRVRPLDPLSPIPEAVRTVEAVPDDVASVVLDLPDAPFSAVAGQVFDVAFTLQDANGFPVEATELLTVRTECGEASRVVQVVDGGAVVPFFFERATGGSCPEQRLTVDDPPGESASFQVIAGPLDHFEVEVAGGATAGLPVAVSVAPFDAFFNVAAFAGALTFDDGTSIADATCEAGTDGVLACSWIPLTAGPTVLVVTGGGAAGLSPTFQVAPNAVPAVLRAAFLEDRAVAGSPIGLDVSLEDAFGNALPAGPFVPFEILVGSEALSCDVVGVDLTGAVLHDCVFVAAGPSVVVDVEGAGLATTVAAIEVVNGPIDRVEVVAPPAAVAGTAFALSLEAFDAFDNAYVEQTDGIVDLRDPTGTLTPASVALDSTGSATVLATIAQAGIAVVDVRQAGNLLGSSAAIDVAPGPADHLDVDVVDPWVWVGQDHLVVVEVVDANGNRVETASGEGTLSSDQVGAQVVDVALINGVATVHFSWVGTAADDVLTAAVGALVGASLPIAVFDACPDGPAIDPSFANSDPTACLMAGAATFVADLSGSVAGGASLNRFGLAAVGQEGSLGPFDAPSIEVAEVGQVALRAVVAQVDGCAAESSATGWVGLDDGSATGPVSLAPANAEIDVSTGITTISVAGVEDCTGDPVAAPLRVRTDLGALSGPTATGAGLEFVTDGFGSATLTLSAAGAPTAQVGVVLAWSPSGAAVGAADFEVVGDDLRPVVWGANPSGALLDDIDEVALTFPEPIDPASISPGIVQHDVDGVPQPAAPAVLAVDGLTLVWTPASPVLAGQILTLTVSEEVRDLSGLRLDGGFVGDKSPFLMRLGGVPPLGLPVTCSVRAPAGGLFRPDGDDGAGEEADRVVLDVSADEAPAWWVLEVLDATGTMIRADHVVPLGPVDEVSWDGRDATGKVVANGAWTLSVAADDGLFHRGTACVAVAIVDNAGPP